MSRFWQIERWRESAIKLAEEYGTPLFVLNIGCIKQSVAETNLSLPAIDLEFANKAVGWPECARLLIEVIPRVMASSEYEASQLRQAGIRGNCIVSWDAGRTHESIEDAMRSGIRRFVLDGPRDVHMFGDIREHLRYETTILLRVLPQSEPDVLGYDRFGMPLADALAGLHCLKSAGFINLGLAYHADVMQSDVGRWAGPRKMLLSSLQRADCGTVKKHLDLGGGLPPASLSNHPLVSYITHLGTLGDVDLSVCLGRYLLADAGSIVTRVVAKKESKAQKYVLVDAGSNLAIPLSSSRFYVTATRVGNSAEYCVCDTFSSFGCIDPKAVLPSDIEVGEIVCINRAGAYTWSMRSQSVQKCGTGIVLDEEFNVIMINRS